MQLDKKILPVILSGGSGTRLWPISRESFPKQYIAVNSSSNLTLLQRTLKRLEGLQNVDSPLIVCNEDQRFIVAEQMREIRIEPKSILLEPVKRNTAPAVTIAALKAIEDGNDSILLILSADHEIEDTKEFQKVIAKAVEYANNGDLVTFGVIPTSPQTGYGYIESQEKICKENLKGSKILRFIEKPSAKKAKELIKDKKFLWNSGIFMFKASSILREIEQFEPKLLELCKKSLLNHYKDFDFHRLNNDSFKRCNSISIDCAVMEKTLKGRVLPLDAGWNDIGTWQALWECEKRDEKGNVLIGNVISENVENCYIKSEKRLIACLGINNLIVIETSDAILVANANQTQDIKKIVNRLNLIGKPEGKKHRKVYRPWGYYFLIDEGSKWQIKKILVNPGASLSLQKHFHRSEHWIIVKGKAKVELNGEVKYLCENQSTYIPLEAKHRLSNPEDSPLILIEVQSGSYLGEDDIIRFQDNYGRTDTD